MSGTDRYQVDLDSVSALTRAWQGAAQSVDRIGRQLGSVHDRLERAIPTALIDGLAGEVPLATAFAALAEATEAARALARGLAQDVTSLQRNHAAYEAAEAEITAKLKAAQEAQTKAKKPVGPHGGATVTSGGGGGGGRGGSGHTGRGSGGGRGGSGHAGGGGSGFGGGARHAGGGGSGRAGVGGGSGSGGGGGDGGGGGSPVQSPAPARHADQDQVGAWIDQAFQLLEASGVPADELDKAGVLLIIEHESGGDPNAINDWDSNAQAGDPSRGLMQTIGATFDAYKLPGHDDIYDPVDNIVAGVRYALSRYGSIQNVPGVASVDRGGSYVGY